MPGLATLFALLATFAVATLFSPRFFTRPLSGGRRFWLAVLQWLPLLALAVLLLDPARVTRFSETRERVIALVVDDSPSMGGPDGGSGASRVEAARAWSEEVVEEWSAGGHSGDVVRYNLDELIPSGRSGSDMAEGLLAVTRRHSREELAGIVWVSDGRDRSLQSPLEVARKLGIPIHTVGIGPESEPESIRGRWLEAPERATVGTPFLVRWGIEARSSEAVRAGLVIRSGGLMAATSELNIQPPETQIEDWESLTLEQGGRQTLSLEVRSLESGELLASSTTEVLIEDTPPTLVVLEGEPSRMVQSLSQAALGDGRYRVVRFQALPEGGGVAWSLFRPIPSGQSVGEHPWSMDRMLRMEASEWEKKFPELIAEAAVVVLGRDPFRGLPERWREELVRFVDQSRAGVLALPGSELGAEGLAEGGLKSLLGWIETRRTSPTAVRVRCPAESRSHPALAPIWTFLDREWEIGPDSYFPEAPSFSEPLLVDRVGRTLTFETRLGLSRAAAVSLSGIWTLPAFSGKGSDSDEARFVNGFWIGLLDSLARSSGYGAPSIHIRPASPSVSQPIEILVEDPGINPGSQAGGLEIRPDGGNWATLLLHPDPSWRGIGKATWIPREVGNHEIRYASGGAILALSVTARPPEDDDYTLNARFLESLAEAGGGRYFPFEGRHEALADFDTSSFEVPKEGRVPMRHDAWIGAALALLFCVGWGTRRLLSLP
ncbi:MAG: hypothetical protein GHCLOJNM_01316 [bacterium]|nr:hypothetical protein [bacterium]